MPFIYASEAPYSSMVYDCKQNLIIDSSVMNHDLLRRAIKNTWTKEPADGVDGASGEFLNYNYCEWETVTSMRDYEVARAQAQDTYSEENLIHGVEFNPFKVTRISDNLVIPNFTVPVRIYGNSEYIVDDEHWASICAGGIYRGIKHEGTVNTTEVFYDTAFSIPLPYNKLEINSIGAVVHWSIPDIQITNQYCHYNQVVREYQDLSKNLPSELLMPNIYTYKTIYETPLILETPEGTANIVRLQEQFGSASIDRVTDLAHLNPTLMQQRTQLRNLQANIITGSGVQTLQRRLLQTIERPYTASNKQDIIDRNKNILFDDFYYRVGGNEIQKTHNIAKQFPYYNRISFTRHVPTINSQAMGEHRSQDAQSVVTDLYHFYLDLGVSEAETAATLESSINNTARINMGTYDVQGSLFLDAISAAGISNQFLESLKNLVLGEYSQLKMKEESYMISQDRMTATGSSAESYSIVVEGSVDEHTMKTVDFVEFINYASLNSAEAISKDVTSQGASPTPATANFVSANRNTKTDSSSDRLLGAGKMATFIPQSIIPQLSRFFLTPFEAAQSAYNHAPGDYNSHLHFQNSLYEAFFNVRDKYYEVVAYRIEKIGGSTTQDQTNENVIQNYWIYNSNHAPASLNFYDSQVKYGEEYTYKVYAYALAVSHRYKYGNFVISKKDQSITAADVYGPIPEDAPDRHCLTFYDPITGRRSPQTFYDGRGLSQTILTHELIGTVPTAFDDPVAGQALFFNFLEDLKVYMDAMAIGTGMGTIEDLFNVGDLFNDDGTINTTATPTIYTNPLTDSLPTQWGGANGFRNRYLNFLKQGVSRGLGDAGGDPSVASFILNLANPGREIEYTSYWSGGNPFVNGMAKYEAKMLSTAEAASINASPLAIVNPAATNSQDISTFPYIADCNLFIEPCVKLIEIPMLSKSLRVYDNPPNAVTSIPFQNIDSSQKVGFELGYDGYKPHGTQRFPDPITPADVDMKNAYMFAKDYDIAASLKSESPQRTLEVYRMDSRPSEYTDFADHLVATVDLKIPNSHYNQIKTTVMSRLELNKKYYFTFRFINENGVPGYPSRVLEVELINDGGYTYAKFDTITEEEMDVNADSMLEKTVKRLLHFVPVTSQLQLDDTEADYLLPANDNLDLIRVGPQDTAMDDSESVWGNTFKIRLVSRKTGKKIDLNITYDYGTDRNPGDL